MTPFFSPSRNGRALRVSTPVFVFVAYGTKPYKGNIVPLRSIWFAPPPFPASARILNGRDEGGVHAGRGENDYGGENGTD